MISEAGLNNLEGKCPKCGKPIKVRISCELTGTGTVRCTYKKGCGWKTAVNIDF